MSSVSEQGLVDLPTFELAGDEFGGDLVHRVVGFGEGVEAGVVAVAAQAFAPEPVIEIAAQPPFGLGKRAVGA